MDRDIMKVNAVKLGDVAKITTGQSAPKSNYFTEEGIPFIRAGSLEFLERDNNIELCEKIDEINAKKCKLKLYPNNSILFAKSGMSAKKGRIYKLTQNAYVVSHLAIIIPNETKIIPEYLLYYLKNYSPKTLIKDESYPSINLVDIANINIVLPLIEEQKKIANILDKVTLLISLRKEQLKKLDELIKSRFIEMFGDPVKDKSIPKEYLEKYLVYVQNGISIRRKIPQNIGEIVFRIKEIRENYIDYTNVNRIPLDDKEKEKYRVNTNELLFIRVNGNKDYVGRNAVFQGYNEDTFFNDHIMRVKVKESELNHIYLSRFLNLPFGKEEIRKYVKTSAGQFTINQQGLGSIELPIPPIEEQNKFASFVEEVEKNKEKVNNSLSKLNILKEALMQKYFEENV